MELAVYSSQTTVLPKQAQPKSARAPNLKQSESGALQANRASWDPTHCSNVPRSLAPRWAAPQSPHVTSARCVGRPLSCMMRATRLCYV